MLIGFKFDTLTGGETKLTSRKKWLVLKLTVISQI